MGARPPARILDQGSHDHVGSHIRRLFFLHKLSIAVIYHADHIRFDLLYKSDQLTDLFYREGRTSLIAFGTLNGYQFCFFIDCLFDIFVIKGTILKKVYLTVFYTIFCKRTIGRTDSDDFFQGIIWFSHRGKKLIARA